MPLELQDVDVTIVLSGVYTPDSTIVTSTKGLYMQPQTHTDCTRGFKGEKILFYFIVQTTIF